MCLYPLKGRGNKKDESSSKGLKITPRFKD
jgi:hypothetical protein